MVRTNKINCIIFLLMQICFLAVTKAHYENVNVKIQNGNELIELNWQRAGQYLANENLPIWYAGKNEKPYRVPHVFEEIGEFITYHDVARSSAVVYITKCNCFYGIIDTRFYIARLPLSNLESDMYYEVGGDYVTSREGKENARRFHHSPDDWLNNIFTDDQIQYVNSVIDSANTGPLPGTLLQHLDHDQRDNNKPSTSGQDQSIAEHPLGIHENVVAAPISPAKILYPEILVFITNDVYNNFMNVYAGNGIHWLALHYIIYFNAIDMLFAKLTTDEIAIHINVAGLVIETEHRAFPHRLWQCHDPGLRRIFYCHGGDTIFQNHPKYIHKYKNIFVQDSYDFFFISTSHAIESNGAMLHGKSTPMVDIFTRRTIHNIERNLLGAIVQQEDAYGDYVTATHQIANLMGITSHLTSGGSYHSDIQCYAIMQASKTHCQNCLNWSGQSRNELKTYVRSNRNHCFLRNYPRSLYPYGQPTLSLSPEDQCMCYNYPIDTLNPFYIGSIPDNGCNRPIQCSYDQNALTLIPLPIDGTPCHGFNHVCWREKCVNLGQSSGNQK